MPRLHHFLLLALATSCGGDQVPHHDGGATLTVAEALGGAEDGGFTRVTEPPTLSWPRDHGPHPGFRTEWWYVTANVDSASGRRFGVELVFFRQALAATTSPRSALLAARDLIFAHAAVSDVDGGRFLYAERMARADGDLAFARLDDGRLTIRCADWSAIADDGARGLLPLSIAAGDGDAFSFDLRLEPGKPIVLQGDRGLSRKSTATGNASIYYSLTRLPISGAITTAGERHEVHGLAWIDREWSTSALGKDQVGWDWFSLQLDDDTELMWYQLRRKDGSSDPLSSGCLVAADGTKTPLANTAVRAEPLGAWTSPDGRATYPARWRLRCDDPPFDIEITPVLADQELHTLVRYWEGAVDVAGTSGGTDVRGRGYLEMTGYAR